MNIQEKRKLMTSNKMHHPEADADCLYLQRSYGGRGMEQREMPFNTTTIRRNIYEF